MDDSTTSNTNNTGARMPLGMSSFDKTQRQQFGQNVRLAMACIEGAEEPVNEKALPLDGPAIQQCLRALSQDFTSQHADLLELLVRFDDVKGWQSSGAGHCAAWMNLELGISPKLGWEYLRIGRRLRLLPTTQALFRAGKLTWSIIRLITRVADPDNEKILCHAALDASVTQVKSLCNGYKWKNDDKGAGENDRALKQWESRALRWDEASNGSTRIQLVLPPELAQAYLNSVEHSLRQLDDSKVDDSESTMSQRRSDAAVLMAETSLQSAGREIATADRYQVVVSVEASQLAASDAAADASNEACKDNGKDNFKNNGKNTCKNNSKVTNNTSHQNHTPSKRPTIKGAGPIACETARRIACDCSVSVIHKENGEPVNIARKSRIWPAAMSRAIKDRDQHCQFPGCTHTHNLHIHHIKHWADNGDTSVENGVCLCSLCHTLVHEGGYTIQRVDDDEQSLNEQFARQQNAHDTSQFDFEKTLRDDKDSFNKVRKLFPTHYRFRVVDANGQDIRDEQTVSVDSIHVQSPSRYPVTTKVDGSDKNKRYDSSIRNHESTRVDSPIRNHESTLVDSSIRKHESTRVECSKPSAEHYRDTLVTHSSFISEQRACYNMGAREMIMARAATEASEQKARVH